MTTDDRELFEELLDDEEFAPGISRDELLKRGAAAGAAVWGVSTLFGAGTAFGASQARPLTPTFYQWIYGLYPDIPKGINKDYAKRHKLDAKIAPVQGFGIDRFVAEAKKKKSTWDVYVGMTPFVEMAALIESGAIEPWDKYISKSVLNDLIPSIRQEATYKGHVWSFPFLLDIIIQAWNGDLVEKAGLDPNKAPKTWDEFIANAKKVVSSKAAPYGAVFDAHGWRSLAPITHTFSTNVYRPDGLFDFTNEATVKALEVMKRLMEVAPKNILEEGKVDAGVNTTPDEEAFAARQAAYYIKYQNAPTRFAGTWPDPSVLHIAGMPKQPGGAGATVFWNTGAALFKYGQNKKLAADYMSYLTHDLRIWKHALGKDVRGASGQLNPYKSTWAKWDKSHPAWIADWAFTVRKQLATSKAIRTHKFGLTQFVLGKPAWEEYLKGDEKDPKKALAKAQALVLAEVKKSKK
ncbi:MAG TPA: extracellular solute-binding protein [Gaiellaceae bacterium]|jgi:ABC-type glycerol-3-phosphate transport system substrate-binding protein